MPNNVVIPASGTGTSTPSVATVLKGSDHVQSMRQVPISGKRTYATSASIAAGGQITLDSDQITSGKTASLTGLHVSASVPLKVELRIVSNSIPGSNVLVDFGRSCSPRIPGPEYVSVAHDPTAGFDGFRVVVTNLDPSSAADVYGTFFYEEV